MTLTGSPLLSIVVVTWNGWRDTQLLLASLRRADLPPHELVVVDNASSDGTPGLLRAAWPEVRLTCNSENRGHAAGVNQAVSLARGDLVLLLDSDTEVSPDAVRRLVEHLQSDPVIGVAAPRTFNTDGSVQQTARSLPSAMSGLFGRRSLLTRWWPGNPFSRRYLMSDHLLDSQPHLVEQVSAACMLFRRGLFMSVGPWDLGYRGYWVDTDWCARVRRAGVGIVCVPASRIVHHEQNRPGRRVAPARIWMFHLGAWRFYRLHRCAGWADPRVWLAGALLALRGLVQLGLNVWRREDGLPVPGPQPIDRSLLVPPEPQPTAPRSGTAP